MQKEQPDDQQPSHDTGFRQIAIIRSLAAALLITLYQGSLSADEEPAIQATLSVREIFIGEAADLQVEVRNVRNPSPPDLTALREQFDVVAAGDHSRNQSSTFIINGRVTQQNVFSHVYSYRLTPRGAGDLFVPPLSILVDGRTIESSRVPLRVLEMEVQDLVIAEIKTSHQAVYPTQPFTVTLRVLVRPLPDDDQTDPLRPLRRRPPHLQINWADTPAGLDAEEKTGWLQPMLSDDGTGFTLNEINTRSGSIFDGPRAAVFQLASGREQRTGLDGMPVNYFVYELHRTFTPSTIGTTAFGPAVVRGTFVNGIEGTEYVARRLVTVATALPVDVRDVPTPRPPTWCGAIGEFHVGAAASPKQLRVGDPLTLTIELQRGSHSGSLERIAAPDLSTIGELMENFDLIDRNPTGRTDGNTKRFTYGLRPRKPDVVIPEITVTVFDPFTEAFSDVTTSAIALNVTAASTIGAGELIGTVTDSGTSGIRSRAEGIFQNITDLAEVHNQHIEAVRWLQGVGLGWLLSASVIAGVVLWRRKAADSGWLRRQQARRQAVQRLQEARKWHQEGKTEQCLRAVRLCIVGLIADMRNRTADGMTAADAAALLSEAGIAAEEMETVSQLLHGIEAAQYGWGPELDSAASIQAATALTDRLSRALERKP